MVTTIRHQRLKVGEFIQFLRDVATICNSNGHAALSIEKYIVPLEESIRKLEAAFQRPRRSELTKEIAALDKRRDHAIICFYSITKAYYRHYFEETKRKAAEKITKTMARYGNSIYSLNYQAETATLSGLVNDLESDPSLAGAVNILGLQPLVQEMKISNTLFNEKYLSRIKEVSEAPEETAVELRKTAMEQYRSLTEMIEAYVLIEGTDMYRHLVDQLNELIEKYNEELGVPAQKGKTERGEEAKA